MRKLALLLSVVILAACGVGGGTNTTGTQGSQQQTGVMKVVLQGETGGKTMAMLNYTAHSSSVKYRLVVTNPSLRINGVAYSNFNNNGDDVVVGQSLPTFTLPVANGYTIEVVKYVTLNGVNKILKYGRSATKFDIAEGANSAVTVTLLPVDITVGFRGYTTVTPVFNDFTTAYASTSQKTYKYGVVALGRYTSSFGLNPNWNMSVKQSSAKTSSPFTSYGGLGGPRAAIFVAQKTPETASPGYLFAQSEFYLKSSLLKSGEASTLFSYVYPDKSTLARTTIDSDVNIRLKVNTGTIPSPSL